MAPTPASDSSSSIGNILARELEHINPTRTIPDAITRVLAARQQGTTTVVAQSNGESSQTLSGGAIAGIVIGSIAGFLIILWIIRSCVNYRNPGAWGTTFEPDNEKPPSSHYYGPSTRYPRETHGHRSRSRHSHRSHHRSPRRTEVVNVTRPVYMEPQRGRSPRAPPAAYYGDGRDVRRSSDGRRRSRGY
ncbi:uncharacterized protein F4822DRAFT_58134 [Hypoxylon trugodes]|uniref:uncharacterized protein n=1 Tax=Hypoxylon trugodes TaxID=326681 RepID=UPI00219E3700|nr:uncharacterized protein F4822DRAFT_58134 [Hypoxylon trugodes]KAI1383997.1 hypothetical protein F4822DRAFT_58134 [Hypoxylon trugodes]